MNTSRLKPGDRVECNVRGNVFNATIVDRVLYQGFHIEPDDLKRNTWRFLRRSNLVKKLPSEVKA